ncbi:MAG: hypothetical protein IJB74_00965 [Clostridia bacterium]|nr:hypothetical protein [Clostridia bacterium]
MKSKVKKFSAIVLYLSIVTVTIAFIQEMFVSVYESADEARIDTFFTQEEDSLDAVFLGPSTTYASWVAPIAFQEYGITVYSVASAAQPLFASKYMIEDMRKKQPDALYIINVTHYLKKYEKYVPNFIETYPLRTNKFMMTAYLSDLGNIPIEETVKMYLPVLKYHSRWSELSVKDLFYKKDKYKSASYYKSFLNKAKNVGSVQTDFETQEALGERDMTGLTDLINYCKKEKLKVLFVIIPQGEECSDRAGKQNTTVSVLKSRGFDVLDLRRYVSDMSIDPEKDFYNAQHMNINGASKVTKFISEYLVEKHGFTDKRNDERYADWIEAAKEYNKLVADGKLASAK